MVYTDQMIRRNCRFICFIAILLVFFTYRPLHAQVPYEEITHNLHQLALASPLDRDLIENLRLTLENNFFELENSDERTEWQRMILLLQTLERHCEIASLDQELNAQNIAIKPMVRQSIRSILSQSPSDFAQNLEKHWLWLEGQRQGQTREEDSPALLPALSPRSAFEEMEVISALQQMAEKLEKRANVKTAPQQKEPKPQVPIAPDLKNVGVVPARPVDPIRETRMSLTTAQSPHPTPQTWIEETRKSPKAVKLWAWWNQSYDVKEIDSGKLHLNGSRFEIPSSFLKPELKMELQRLVLLELLKEYAKSKQISDEESLLQSFVLLNELYAQDKEAYTHYHKALEACIAEGIYKTAQAQEAEFKSKSDYGEMKEMISSLDAIVPQEAPLATFDIPGRYERVFSLGDASDTRELREHLCFVLQIINGIK